MLSWLWLPLLIVLIWRTISGRGLIMVIGIGDVVGELKLLENFCLSTDYLVQSGVKGLPDTFIWVAVVFKLRVVLHESLTSHVDVSKKIFELISVVRNLFAQSENCMKKLSALVLKLLLIVGKSVNIDGWSVSIDADAQLLSCVIGLFKHQMITLVQCRKLVLKWLDCALHSCDLSSEVSDLVSVPHDHSLDSDDFAF
jgi:hypothetical protein